MKHYGILVLSALFVCNASFANDIATDSAHDAVSGEAETTVSHNPLTKKTTTTTQRKSKRHHKRNGKGYTQEDQVKVEKQTTDDGSKTRVTREETHTDKEN